LEGGGDQLRARAQDTYGDAPPSGQLAGSGQGLGLVLQEAVELVAEGPCGDRRRHQVCGRQGRMAVRDVAVRDVAAEARYCLPNPTCALPHRGPGCDWSQR